MYFFGIADAGKFFLLDLITMWFTLSLHHIVRFGVNQKLLLSPQFYYALPDFRIGIPLT